MHVSLGFMIYNKTIPVLELCPRNRVVIDYKSQSTMHIVLTHCMQGEGDI